MSTHAVIGIQMPAGDIMGCYVHYDGHTIFSRIHTYLNTHTTTDLAVMIAKGQACGGLRSFPLDVPDDLLENDAYAITHENWSDDHFGANYKVLVNYETGTINPDAQ